MLLRWNKSAKLAIEAGRVTARTTVGGALVEIAEVVAPAAGSEDRPERYDNLAAAVRNTLAQLALAAPRGLHMLDVTVADTFAFYDVLEIDARVLSSADLNRVAGLGLADTLGLEARELVIRCSVQKGGLSAVVCGLPLAFLEAVKHEIENAGYRLNRMEPAFAEFLNRHRSMAHKRDALIARRSGDSLMLGLLRGGNWQAFAAERLSGMDWSQLRDSCEAFCSRVSVPDRELLPVLFDAEIGEIPAEARDRWQPLPAAAGIS